MTTILLIDDNAADLEIIRRAFTSVVDVAVTATQSATEALDWFGEHGDMDTLVVTDLNMPGVDGIALIERLTALCDVPPVMLVFSTSARAVDVNRAYLAGANGYHTKPMGFHETTELCAEIANYWLRSAALPRRSQSSMRVRNAVSDPVVG